MLISRLLCATVTVLAATECAAQVGENNEVLLLQTSLSLNSAAGNSAKATFSSSSSLLEAVNASALEEVKLDLEGEQSSSPHTHSEESGLTLVMMSRNPDRFADLKEIISGYRRMPVNLLSEIVLIWNNPSDIRSLQELEKLTLGEGVPLRIVAAKVNSMNNRFAIWENISTDGVIIQDDDLLILEQDLRCLIAAWRANPQRLVGGHAALLEKSMLEDGQHGYTEHVKRPGHSGSDELDSSSGYSMLFPHPWITSKSYLRMYMEKREGPELVDAMMNCDDIYMNAVVANFTRMPPLLVNASVYKFPTSDSGTAMWQSDPRWPQHRSECIEKVNAFYKDEPADAQTGTVFRFADSAMNCSY